MNWTQPSIRAMAAPWRNGVEIRVWDRENNRHLKELIFEDSVEGMDIKPSFSINNSEAQALMDDLWQAGIRPTEGSGSAGSLRATERHLEDFRKLVFKKNYNEN